MFPFRDELDLGKGLFISVDEARKAIAPMLTPSRIEKIQAVVNQRTFSVSLVLENIYDRGNASAAMRSAEALGFASVHMIETGEKFKNANRVTQGAEKWIETTKWPSTKSCIEELKKQGQQIIVTYLDSSSVPISEVDFSKPTALVLGNEKEGVSPEMIALADKKVLIPMVGFVQSYNISVAAALALYHAYQDRVSRLGKQGDLSERQKQILELMYYMRTQDSSWDLLREMVSRGRG